MNARTIQTLFDYHYGMYQQVWDCVMELTEAQFVRETDYSLRSVRNHLVHCMSVDNRWLARIQNQTPPKRLESIHYPNQDAVRLKWNAIRQRVLNYTDSLTQEALNETVQVEFPRRGGQHRNLRWEILLHMVNHGTDHRAQILARLHELGAATIEQDLMLHLWAKQA